MAKMSVMLIVLPLSVITGPENVKRFRYILREHYLTNDRHAQVNLPEEITDVMLAYGRPIHTDELKQALHHFPPNQVERTRHLAKIRCSGKIGA